MKEICRSFPLVTPWKAPKYLLKRLWMLQGIMRAKKGERQFSIFPKKLLAAWKEFAYLCRVF